MKLAVGVMGASVGDLTDEVRQRAYRLGEAIAEHGAILVTGACPGLPYEAVRGAKAKDGLVVGISPGCRSKSTGASTDHPSRASTCSSTRAAA
jgi:uncharacterized protein (TIGR00725 family)